MAMKWWMAGLGIAAVVTALVIKGLVTESAGNASGTDDSQGGRRSADGRTERSAGKWGDLLRGREAKDRWQELLASGAEGTPVLAAEFLGEWMARDQEAAVQAFGDFIGQHPDSAAVLATEMGRQSPLRDWQPVLAAAEKYLDERGCLLIRAGAAVAISNHDPGKALEMCAKPTDTADAAILSAQRNARKMVVENAAKADLEMASKWVENEAKNDGLLWGQLCEGIRSNGLAAYSDQELRDFLGRMPVQPGLIEKLVHGPEGAGHVKPDAGRLLRQIDAPDAAIPSDKRAALLTGLSRMAPELFDAEYFATAKSEDALYVGQGRSSGSLRGNITWASTLKDPEQQKMAVHGFIGGMMDQNTYTTSRMVAAAEVPPDFRKIMAGAMADWLEKRGMTEEAGPWREAAK